MIGGPAHQHLALGGDPEHFVILAAEGEELAGQVLLEHLALQLGAQILAAAVLVLGNVLRRPQASQQDLDETAVGDAVHILHDAGVHGEPALELEYLSMEAYVPVGRVAAQGLPSVPVGLGTAQVPAGQADLMPQGFGGVRHIPVNHHQLPADVPLRHQAGTHSQAQPQGHVPGGAGIVGGDVGDGLGVGVEDAVVGGHVILQQILGGDYVDKALLRGTGGEVTLHLEHIEALVLHGQIPVLPGSGAPQIVGHLKAPVHGLLGGRQVGVAQQVIVILLHNPVDVHHRKCLAAVPVGFLHLIFQGGEGQLRAHAQIPGQIGQHPVLQRLAGAVPAHIGGRTPMVVGGGDLPQAGHKDVGQRIHQAVAVLVGGAEHKLLFLPAAVAHQGVEAHLGGGHQPGGLQQNHELGLIEEVPVHLMELQVMDAGPGHDAHIQVLGAVRQQTDVPQRWHIGHGGQTVPAPGFDVFLHPMATQNHQHLLMPQQAPVHGVENVRNQIIIEGVVEQHAFPVQKLLSGEQIVPVQLHTALRLGPHESAIGLLPDLVAVLQSFQQAVVAGIASGIVADGGILCPQLVGEQLPQDLSHHGVVAVFLRLLFLAGQLLTQLLLGQAVQEEVQLADENHAEHRVEGRRQPAV